MRVGKRKNLTMLVTDLTCSARATIYVISAMRHRGDGCGCLGARGLCWSLTIIWRQHRNTVLDVWCGYGDLAMNRTWPRGLLFFRLFTTLWHPEVLCWLEIGT